jgi:putative aldouronate transport system substrate-binding protein
MAKKVLNVLLLSMFFIGVVSTNSISVAQSVDPFGKYSEPVVLNIAMSVAPTLTLPPGDNLENDQYTRHIKDNLNIIIKVAWQAASGDNYTQKVNLAIASNNLPDAMTVYTPAQLRQMVKFGQLEDLTEAYNKYASPAMKTMMKKAGKLVSSAVTFNGKMLAIPAINVPEDGYHLMWIRKDWLDKLGLKPPRTIDELEKVAKAFVDMGTIGISGPQSGGLLYANFLAATNNTFGFDPIFSAYHSYPGFWIKGADGNPVYGSILPETKKALAKLRDLYSKGLIDKQMGIRKDSAEPVVSGKSGIFFGPWWMGYWPLPDAITNDPKANWQAYAAPLDEDGRWTPHLGTPANSFTVVRKGYEHPEAVVKILNLLIRDESKFDFTKGGIGLYPLRVPMAPLDEGEVTVKAGKAVLAGIKKPEDYDVPQYDIYKLLRQDVRNIKEVKLKPYDRMDIQYWNPKANMTAWSRWYSLMVGCSPIYAAKSITKPVYSLIYYPTKTMETKWATLKKLEDETFMKIIMGVAPLDSFDKFVEDWKKLGGDEITAEVKEEIK